MSSAVQNPARQTNGNRHGAEIKNDLDCFYFASAPRKALYRGRNYSDHQCLKGAQSYGCQENERQVHRHVAIQARQLEFQSGVGYLDRQQRQQKLVRPGSNSERLLTYYKSDAEATPSSVYMPF